jgi:large subunit ribosomal protein L32
MPVPKRKTSKSRRDKRSAGKRKAHGSVASCQTCKSPVACHAVCKACGYYRGIKVERTRVERMQGREVARRAKQRTLEENATAVAKTEKVEVAEVKKTNRKSKSGE